MEFREYLKLIRQKKQTIISVVILFLVFSIALTFVQPFKYSSEAKILVVQSAPAGVDPYQVSKANEYVSDVLAKVIPSGSFYNEVFNAGFNINQNYFSNEPRKRLKEWKKTVSAHSSNNSGIISVSVFHKDKYQADQIMRGIIAVLKSKHSFYHGSGEQVNIRVIDQPFNSDLPVKPNLPLNSALGLVFGLIFALSYIYLFPEESYNLKFISRKKKKKEHIAEDVENNEKIENNNDVQEAILKFRKSSQNFKEHDFQESDIGQADYANEQEITQSRQADVEPELLDHEEIIRQGKMENIFKS